MDPTCCLDPVALADVAFSTPSERGDVGMELRDHGNGPVVFTDSLALGGNLVPLQEDRSGKKELSQLLSAALGDAAPAAAERLLCELASLQNVVNADINRLTYILNGQRVAAQLVVAAKGLIEASFTEVLARGPLCVNDKNLLKYLGRRMKGRRQEILLALFADQDCNFIREEELGVGSAWAVSVRPRTLFGRALALDARSILLVHNHPSGEARASEADINSMRSLVQQARKLDISIIDHLIVGGSQIYSMKKGRNW